METNRRLQISFFVFWLAIVLLPMVSPASAQEAESAELVDIISEVVVGDLNDPTDFSVTPDGDVVFIAERGAGQIRRVRGNASDVVVNQIESGDESAGSIAVHAINKHRILVGVSGFSSAQHALCLFDVSSDELPLDFVGQPVKHSRSYERSLKRLESFSVLRLFGEQRGLAMVCRFGEAPSTLCDIHFKQGNLERLAEHNFETNFAKLSTLAVDQMGGYLVALTQEKPTKIVFYRAGRSLIQSFSIELENIVSMSFSPTHNRLFALVNNGRAANGSGGDGIYEILTNGDACKSRFVIAIERPEKLKFDAQGNGWVLCRSEADSGRGLLKKINNLDVSPAIVPAQEQDSNED